MPFISASFLFLFLPISLAFHYIAVRFGERIRLCALIPISLGFCAAWDWRAAVLLAGSIAVNYGCGRFLEEARDDESTFQANLFLALGIGFNLAMLVVFRYAEFLLSLFDPAATDFAVSKLLVPLGVLIYSCDQIAYLADLRRGKSYDAGFIRYAAFATFFPRLIAGPLLRYERFQSQWIAPKLTAEDFAAGFATFTIGLAKVVLLAGAVAPFSVSVFSAAESGTQIDFFASWTGLLAFTCQIYFDLSGYADMAIGLARCFGIVLPVNFQSPYRSANIADFWRTWNVTLSDFLRDYVYRPLSGVPRITLRSGLSLAGTMVLGGLWYGGSQMLVAWALLHTIFLLLHRAYRAAAVRFDLAALLASSKLTRALGTAFTFSIVTLAWIAFRSPDPATALDLLIALSGQNGALLPASYASFLGVLSAPLHMLGIGFASIDGGPLLQAWISILVCLVVIFALPNTETLLQSSRSVSQNKDKSEQGLSAFHWFPSPLWAIALGVLAFGCLVSASSINPVLHWRL